MLDRRQFLGSLGASLMSAGAGVSPCAAVTDDESTAKRYRVIDTHFHLFNSTLQGKNGIPRWLTQDATCRHQQAAREKFLPPLEAHLQTAGLGHISEIAHGDPPHTPAGCPFQAWSLGEFLRLKQRVLA